MNKLLEILKKQLNIYEELLKISKDKTDIIKEDKAPELSTLVNREETLVSDIVNLEKERLSVIDEICTNKGISSKNIKLLELSNYVDEKEELLDLREKINKKLKELKHVNDLNQKLIKNSLEYINFAVNLATSSGNMNTIYEQKGQAKAKGQRNIFDMKL